MNKMEITVNRKWKKQKYTISNLIIDGKVFSQVLEDTDRGLTSTMSKEEISKKKVYGNTAIPTGTYTIDMNTVSPSFKNRSWAKPYGGKIPRLLNVPGFDGILIHPGNTASDTSGCLLVGKNTIVGKVTDSVNTFNKLMRLLLDAKARGEVIKIHIV